jgi:hypothetical protein
MLRLSAALILFLALPAAAQSRWDGEYFNGIDACGSPNSVLIRGDRARLFGECRLTNATDLRGLQAQAFDLVCPAEGGRTASERVILSFGAEGDLLVVRNAGWSGFTRCR